MSRARPYLADGLDYQGRHPEMACWDSTKDDRTKQSRVIDFFVACILAAAMTIMEEPAEREPSPPAYPWRDLGIGAAVVLAVALCAYFSMPLFSLATQVAAR